MKVLKGIICKENVLITFEHECPFLIIDNVECSKGWKVSTLTTNMFIKICFV
jgi:hypothetical protein